MIFGKKSKEKPKKVHKKFLDKRNYFIFALLGVLLIGVLMILQTRFQEYFRLNNSGYAIVSDTITQYLAKNPEEEGVETLVSMQSFDASEYMYTQGGKYFLGEKEKQEIDISYPIYMNQGAVLQLVESSGVLYDEDYEKEATYQGLMLESGYAYNMDGTQADATKYVFLGMNNGNFINFENITYDVKNEEYDINENSLVHFDADFFSYYEFEDGALVYKYCISVNDYFKLKVGEKEYTYDELLKLLGLRSEFPEFEGIIKDNDEKEDITDAEIIDEFDSEASAEVEVKKPKREDVEPPSRPSGGSSSGNTHTSPGVRPDNVTRPGSSDTTVVDRPESVQGYVKPSVTITNVTGGVYRILLDSTIVDPASRIDSKKFVRFEVYEVLDDGKEQLAMRSYRRGSGQDVTTLGSGSIKPDTTYRITGYYTYYDEYDKEQYVVIDFTPEDDSTTDIYVSTMPYDANAYVTLKHTEGTRYHNKIEVANFGYDKNSSDAEYVYGINTYAGVTFTVREKSTGDIVTSRSLTAGEINSFKLNKGIYLNSLMTLKAKTWYEYEFTAEDFFGNTIKLENNIGEAMTSNSAPVATITENVNEIGKLVLNLSIEDLDVAAVPSASETDAETDCDVYFVMIKGNSSNSLNREFASISEMEEAGVLATCRNANGDVVPAYKKLDSSQYNYDTTNGLVVNNLELEFNGLRLGEKYYAAVYTDYDLSNKQGAQRFKIIGSAAFITESLSSLGKIFVTVDFDTANLTYKSLPMAFHLNTEATSEQLTNIITGMKVEIVSDNDVGDDAKVYGEFSFDETTTAKDDKTGVTIQLLESFKNNKAIGYTADNLKSMTEYKLRATIFARYEGEEYEITPQLSNYTFKTLRMPAEVIVEDLLFAAGTLLFDVKVTDPDDTIIGVYEDKVIVQLYTAKGEFVKTVRIEKELEDWQTVTFNNLDPSEKYEIRFIANEYNEGYTNASYRSNHILKIVEVNDSMSLDGTIKLQEINEVSGDNTHYQAVVKATLNDEDHYLTGENAIPYYIKVEKDGVLIEDVSFDLSDEPEDDLYEKLHLYTVDKGDYTYHLTMYVIISDRVVELDTLTFTSETTVEGFSNAYEMIQKLRVDSDGKYVATNSFVLNSNSWNFKGIVDPGDVENMSSTDLSALGTGLSGANIVNIFNGQIDFQGFTLTHNMYADGQRMFTNIGSKGVFENVVYNVKNLNTTRIYDDACLCYRNFGTIRDIYIKYRGGYVLNNEYYGLLARVNASTGVIENFVVENKPEDEEYAGFSAYRYAGLLTYDNYGIIRYGYVYGDNIITTAVQQSLTREIGGIVGANRTLGTVTNVYSLLNVDETSMRPDSDYTYGNYYGAVCGQSWGKMNNMYSTKDSYVVESKNDGTNGYQFSPVIGRRNNATNSNVYYYSAENTYELAVKNNKAYDIDLNQLYDVTWQTSVLSDRFDISLVEVGYYPHIKLSSDLPEQEYIPLPERTMSQAVEISRATVLEYYSVKNETEGTVTDCATVEFVFFNRDGFDIVGLDIKDIDVELDLATAKYEDGYTTIMGVISNPRTFYSEYEISSVKYYQGGKPKANALNYPLKADFYRKIYTVDDWYNYMVNRKNVDEFENVKLEKDLDFTGVAYNRIMVTKGFNRILDGNGHTLYNIDLQYGFNAKNNTTRRRLFDGDLAYSGVVKNVFIENYKAGGQYKDTKTGKTYVSQSAAVFGTVYGLVENVHATNVDIISYEYAAGLVCYIASSGEIKDSSVTNLKLTYNDPDDKNADSYIGGVVGRLNEARVTHCYARNIDINVNETKSTYGIGGVVGYASNSVVDTAYAEGKITSRAQKVGGIVGHYYSTSAAIVCTKNMYAKVDIICYTDVAGGLIGQTNITQDRISATNNFSGLALGNVYLSNLDSKNCSQTIGANIGKNATFYGTKEQLINGIAGIGYEGKEDCVRGLVSYEQLTQDSANTYYNIIDFEKVYSMEGTNQYLPMMYYTDSNEILPNQKENRILLDELSDVDIEVTQVFHTESSKLVTVELYNPNNYKITDIHIDKLDYYFVDLASGNKDTAVSIEDASDYSNGYTRIYLKYKDEGQQSYFLDSYVMDKITFYPVKNSGNKLLDDGKTQNPSYVLNSNLDSTKLRGIDIYSRINVMLCMDIGSTDEWKNIAIRENQGHIYENYRITQNLDFKNDIAASNLKIGRLVSKTGTETISNVDLSGYDMHLISRLNSGIKGITFKNCTIASDNVGCIGLVGVSNGTIIDCNFENITIVPRTDNTDEQGIIGHSNGGTFENITLTNVTVGNKKSSIDYVGALAGRVQDGSTFTNIQGTNLKVTGTGSYVGGIAGCIENADVKDIILIDIYVDGSSSYTGGMAGMLGTSNNANGRVMQNIELIGTPTYDSNGKVTESTTTIKGNNQVGGLCGNTAEKAGTGYQASKQEPNVYVDGVVITGLNNLGGVYGVTSTALYHITVKNALVETRDWMKATTAYNYVGGVIGQTTYSATRALNVENIKIDVTNTSNVGGICGMYRLATMQYCFVKDSTIEARKATGYSGTLINVGGINGRYENTMYYDGVINTIIDAPEYSNVGGIVGRLSESLANNHYIGNCFYIATYDEEVERQFRSSGADRYTAAAITDYYIKGKTNVGGIVGKQNSGYVFQSYSNANVIAGNGGYAGGIAGMYNNEYTTSVSNGKTYYTYAVTGMYRNYFAGTVNAPNGYAGGAIGRTGLLYAGLGTDESGNVSLTGTNGNRIKNTNANCNEVDKTYGNMIIADSITGGAGKTGAFAADDVDFKFIGRDNRIWDKTKVNNVYAGAIKKANGTYAYGYWNTGNTASSAFPSKLNQMQVFESTDLDGSAWCNSTNNRAAVFYRTIGWSLSAISDANKDYASRESAWRVSVGDIPDGTNKTRGMKDQYETTGYNTGSYLPQPRDTDRRAYRLDTLIKMQETVPRLPLPRDTNDARTLDLYSTYRMRALETTYGLVYASDVDKINLEFSADLVNNGYYTLISGDTVIANEMITQRTQTFSYPFDETLTFEYGFLTDNTLEEDMLLNGSNLEELESVLLGVDDLKTDIMVYRNDYYYIKEDGLVSSNGTWCGEFITVMNGKVLDSDGNVWDVESKTKKGLVSDIEKQDDSRPLWTFVYGGFDIETYAKYSHITSEYSEIERGSQLFVLNDNLYTVDGTLETRKTDILLYNLNGTMYQTVLGNDGMMVDMMQGDYNIPEEVENQAIVRMSNTLSASVPYVLVEYNNGGIIGYNYATGDILFDNRIETQVSLLDYAKNFFSGKNDSQYASINDTYSANAELSDRIHSEADLKEIVGNSSGELVTDNSTGENTSSVVGVQDMSDSTNAQAGNGVQGTSDALSGQGSNEENFAGAYDEETGTYVSTDEDRKDADSVDVIGENSNSENTTTQSDEVDNDFETSDSTDTSNDVDDSDKTSSVNDTEDMEKTENLDSKDSVDSESTDDSETKSEDMEKTDSEIKEEKDNISVNPPSKEAILEGSSEYMTVYNNATGMYELVSVAEYLTKDAYISENHKLGIQDLTQHANGYAASKVDANQERGIIMYLVPILIIFALAGGIIVYVRYKERRRTS